MTISWYLQGQILPPTRIIGIKHEPLFGKKLEEAFPDLVATDIPDLYRKVALGEIDAQSLRSPLWETDVSTAAIRCVYLATDDVPSRLIL